MINKPKNICWTEVKNNAIYNDFINSVKNQIIPGEEAHIHHIIPKHFFKNTEEYCESKENLILLSLSNHVAAHQLLYDLFGQEQDKGAVLMLGGDKAESRRVWRRLGAHATHSKLKQSGTNFWDPTFQKEMGQRSLAKPDALESRSRGGKVGGRNRNKGLAILKKDRYLFYYEKSPVLCILNCETGGDVLSQLQAYKKTNLQRTTPLLNGTRKNLNGWSCEIL